MHHRMHFSTSIHLCPFYYFFLMPALIKLLILVYMGRCLYGRSKGLLKTETQKTKLFVREKVIPVLVWPHKERGRKSIFFHLSEPLYLHLKCGWSLHNLPGQPGWLSSWWNCSIVMVLTAKLASHRRKVLAGWAFFMKARGFIKYA